MDKRIAAAIISCWLDPELEDRKSIREYLIKAGIDSEKFRVEILQLLKAKMVEAGCGLKENGKCKFERRRKVRVR
jgi:hypothetical protein